MHFCGKTFLKTFLVLIIAGCEAICRVQAGAFELALGGRYSGSGTLSSVGSSGAVWQGEFLAGPLQIATGYVPGAFSMYPITIGLLNKFSNTSLPLPLLKPYLGGDFTYYIAPDIQGSVWSVQAKGGLELQFSSFGVFLGLGYAYIYLSVPGYQYPGGYSDITWELGARYYLLK